MTCQIQTLPVKKKPLEVKLDLAWARQHLAGFAKYERQANEVKASEAEYKKLLVAAGG